MNENFLKEAEKVIKELELYKGKNSKLADYADFLKKVILQKDKKISEQEKKINELLRAVIGGDREIKNLKDAVISKTEAIKKIPELKKVLEGRNLAFLYQKNKLQELLKENKELKKQIGLLNEEGKENNNKLNHLKKIILEKNKNLLGYEKKIDELIKVLVKSDKISKELKENLYWKDEKINKISEKSKNRIIALEKNNKNGFEELKSLYKEKQALQVKLADLLDKNSGLMQEIKKVSKIAEEKSKKLEDINEEKENIENLYKELEERGKLVEKLTLIAKQSRERIRNLEDINKKLFLQYEGERAVLNKIINEKEKKLARSFQEETKKPVPVSVVIKEKKENVPVVFDPREVEAMIKIGLQHGDTIENIRKSLVSAGYEEEKIEKIIKRA